MRIRTAIAVRVFALGLAAALSTPSRGEAQRRPFRHFSVQDGLQQLVATAIVEDADGQIWVGTEGGLHVFRNDRFVEVAVGGRRGRGIRALAPGPEELWVGTNGGLFVRRRGNWERFGPAQGLTRPYVRAIRKVGPTLWVGTARGLYRRGEGRFRAELDFPAVPVVDVRAACGHLWVGTQFGLFVKDATKWNRVSSDAVRGMMPNVDGDSLWVAFRDRAERWHNGKLEQQVEFRDREIIHGWRGLVADRRHVLWVGTDRGVLELTPRRSIVWGPDRGQPVTMVNALFEDREGGLWLGGLGGVVNLPDQSFESYSLPEGLPSARVGAVARTEDGQLWVGTDRGLAVRRKERFTRVAGLSSAVTSLRPSPDRGLLVGHENGLHRWTGGQKDGGLRPDPDSDRFGAVYSIAHHPAGALWVAAANGVFRTTQTGTQRVEVPEQTLLTPRLLIDHRGRVWVSGNEGVSVYDGHRWRTYRVDDGLARNDPDFLAEDQDGGIWFGYHGPGGVTRFDGETFETFTTRQGLASDRVFSVGADDQGYVWIGSAGGVDRFDGKQFVHFSPADGYPSTEASGGGFYRDLDGSLWMATPQGLAHFRPDRAADATTPPDVRITAPRVGGSTLTAGLHVHGPEVDLSARYEVRSRYRRTHVDVQYRVGGTWMTARGGQIRVRDIPIGAHTFEVRARRRPGRWQTVERRTFEVVAPVWARPSVWAGLGFPVALAFGWLVQRLRWRRSEAHNARLRTMVEARTQALRAASHDAEAARDSAERANRAKSEFLANMSHEIRTPLNAVLGTTALLMETPLDQEQQELALTAQRSSEALLGLIDEILDFSRIEAGHLELVNAPLSLPDLVTDTLRLMETHAQSRQICLAYYLSPQTPAGIVGDEARLRQILINLVANAVKFTPSGEVGVTVTTPAPDRLQFTVTDTGIGIPKEAQAKLFEPFTQVDASTSRRYGGSGLGLTISHRLVTAMGGQMTLESEPGQGAAFTIRLPLVHSDAVAVAPAHGGALEGRKVDVVTAGPVSSRALAAWMTSWGATPRIFRSQSEFLRAPADDAHATIFVLNGWREPVCPRTLVEQKRIDPTRWVFIGRPRSAGGYPAIGEPIRPRRLLEATQTAVSASAEVDAGPPPSPASPFSPTLGRDHPLDILVVDDNPVNREVASRMLQRLGYDTIRCAEDGDGAISEVLRAPPDIVFMDVQMPGIDGLEATRQLRRLPLDAQPRIVALTAGVLAEDQRACADAGMDDFVAKPVRVAALVEALRRCPSRSVQPGSVM